MYLIFMGRSRKPVRKIDDCHLLCRMCHADWTNQRPKRKFQITFLPIRDWARAEAGDFNHFHQTWISARTPVLWAGGGCLPVNAPDDIPTSEAFVDCSGKQRVFSLECHQVPTGWAVIANEVTDNDFGYRFEGFSPSNPYLALGQVRAKVRTGLAIRYLSAAEAEPSLSHDILRGHIDYDRTTDSPVLVVDGRPLTILDLERILGCYEGWRVELRIAEPAE